MLTNKLERRELLGVAGLAFFGCLLRIALIPYGGFITNDGVYYVTLGRHLLAGDLQHGMSAYWPPLYPLLTGLVDRIFHDAVYSGRLVSALAGGLLVIVVYLLARRLTVRRLPALVAAIFVIFEPTLISYSLMVLTESVYTLLFITGILLGLVALEEKKGVYFFLTGLLFGLAYLAKPEALGFVLLLELIVVAVGVVQAGGVRWVGSRAALICLGALLMAAPYLVYLRHETGKWMLSEKFGGDLPGYMTKPRRLLPDGQLTNADVVWGGVRPDPSSGLRGTVPVPEPDSASSDQAPASRIGSLLNSFSIAKRTLRGLYDEYGMIGQLMSPLILLLVGVGLFGRPWSAERLGPELYLGAFLFTTFLGYAFALQQVRYLVPLIPLALCWAAVGALRTAGWLDSTFTRFAQMRFPRVRLGPLRARFIVIAAVVLSLTVETILGIKYDNWDPRPVVEWIRSQGLTSPLIMSTGPWPAFYTGGRHLYIPNEEMPVVLAYAKRKKIDFLILEKRSLDRTPALAPLLDAKVTADVTKVYEYDDSRGRLVIYRLNQDSSHVSNVVPLSAQGTFQTQP